MGNFIDMTGKRLGRLVVLHRVARYTKEARWRCQCDCGNRVTVRGANLRNVTRSCGCYRHERVVARNTKHGLANDHKRAFNAWNAAVQRCHNENNPKYGGWGGRGIKVCKQWRRDFAQFLADMGDPPIGKELDRKNNNKGYSPKNCRWVTKTKNMNNRRNTTILKFRGRTQPLRDWARELGVPASRIWGRLKRKWSVRDALTKPMYYRQSNNE